MCTFVLHCTLLKIFHPNMVGVFLFVFCCCLVGFLFVCIPWLDQIQFCCLFVFICNVSFLCLTLQHWIIGKNHTGSSLAPKEQHWLLNFGFLIRYKLKIANQRVFNCIKRGPQRKLTWKQRLCRYFFLQTLYACSLNIHAPEDYLLSLFFSCTFAFELFRA